MKTFAIALTLTVSLATVSLSAATRPNIVILLADDMGYSDLGCYGGEIETPNIDRLAENGLRFTDFYNAGRCCPTRASLLTGLYAHQAGIGHMTNEDVRMRFDMGYEGYRGQLNRQCVTIAEALKPAGYRTLMTGKWHVGTFPGMWPVDRGFDRYFGTIRGAANFFRPNPNKLLTLDRTPVVPADDYYSTDTFTDYALKFIDDAEREDDDQPFFLYLAYMSPHWPLHAPEEDVAKYRGKYRGGWDKLRAERLDRMRRMGLIDRRWKLAPLDAVRWSALPASTQDEMDLRMATYAAQIDRMDQNIGRLVEGLEAKGELENTLIFFLIDNGGCAEGGMLGGGPAWQLGSKKGYFLTYGRGWAQASNTPFREYKHWVHEGGVSTPLVVQWLDRVEKGGAFRRQPAHLIDLMATALDVAGAEYPTNLNGESIRPLEGKSLVPAFDDERIDREAIYFEHEGNRAVRTESWKLVAKDGRPWELYDVRADRSEADDLSTRRPAVRDRLVEMYNAWASRAHVLPGRPERKPGFTPPQRDYPPMADYEP